MSALKRTVAQEERRLVFEIMLEEAQIIQPKGLRG